MKPSMPHQHCFGRDSQSRGAAFTLVELLVAATLALVVMAALATLLGIFGRAVANSQELVQLGGRMRSTAWRLRQDLQGATAPAKPFARPESASGYLEIIEGPMIDAATMLVADVDDVLMLTTESPGRPFTGLLSGTASLESPLAEVAWFCKLGPLTADGLQLYNLYRRQLLVAATPGAAGFLANNRMPFSTWATWDEFFLNNDISARREGSDLIANSLADLTRRQSRFMHNPGGAANPSVRATWPQITTAVVPALATGTTEVLTSVREGEDLILGNVVSFDVRVFDPQQLPGGAFVNVGSRDTARGELVSLLTGSGAVPFTGMPAGSSVYDTWSIHTEFNNVTDSPPKLQDQGTNLVDDNGNGVVDDVGELEQPPPYNVPLRGIEIRIRCYEPSSQEVRQITVQHSFLAP